MVQKNRHILVVQAESLKAYPGKAKHHVYVGYVQFLDSIVDILAEIVKPADA